MGWRGAQCIAAPAPAALAFTSRRRSIHGTGLTLEPWTVAAVAAGPPQT
jgi:hypothetical protein